MRGSRRIQGAVAIALMTTALGVWGCGAPRGGDAAHDHTHGEHDGHDHGTPAADAATGETNAGPAIFAVYEGTLPCADCGGIRTELTLLADGSSYRLAETYLATKDGDVVNTSAGTWAMVKGIPSDSTATVFRLDPGSPEGVRHFLMTTETEVRLLDKDLNPIVSDLNHSLTKRSAAPAS